MSIIFFWFYLIHTWWCEQTSNKSLCRFKNWYLVMSLYINYFKMFCLATKPIISLTSEGEEWLCYTDSKNLMWSLMLGVLFGLSVGYSYLEIWRSEKNGVSWFSGRYTEVKEASYLNSFVGQVPCWPSSN